MRLPITALFFVLSALVTVSFGMDSSDDRDLPKGLAIAVDWNTGREILLTQVINDDNDEKKMATIERDEWQLPRGKQKTNDNGSHNTVHREFGEETGNRSGVVRTNAGFTRVYDAKDVPLDAWIVDADKNAPLVHHEDAVKRQSKWFDYSEVASKLHRPEMLQSWKWAQEQMGLPTHETVQRLREATKKAKKRNGGGGKMKVMRE